VTEPRKGPAVAGGLSLGPDQCRPLSRALSRAIDLAFGEAGKARVTQEDVILFDFTAQVLEVARGSARKHADSSARFREALTVPTCSQEPALTVTEAAEAIGISEEYVRRLCRRGRAFKAWRGGPRGAWLIDAGEFGQWAASHRKEDNGRAA
jgi:excisionase family DNA binding protein